ncbi:hypothetical protein PAXINDRAFT_95140, partial [Paxillus involutus ATCC 200175]
MSEALHTPRLPTNSTEVQLRTIQMMDVDEDRQLAATVDVDRANSHDEHDAMSLDRTPQDVPSPPVVNGMSAEGPVEEQETLRPKPTYRAKFILSGHAMAISSLKFSPDGTLLASSGALLHILSLLISMTRYLWKQAADKLVKVWDAYTGEILKTYEGHHEGVNDVAWSSDGEFLASASDDKSIIIWSMELENITKTLRGHTNFVFCVNFNPRSNLLVSGGYDETVRVWDVARGRSLKVLPAHSDPVTAVGFNHDGTLIVSCSMDGLIRMWDSDSGQCLKTLVDDDNPICSHVKFSPNSKFILAATQDSTIRLWNYQISRCVKTYTGHVNRTYCLITCFSTAKGHYVVSGAKIQKSTSGICRAVSSY